MLGHDLSYLLEVLDVADGETEEQLDEKLKTEAKELGVDIAAQQLADDEKQPLKAYWTDCSRRSESIDSRSTGLTSTCSDVSRDQGRPHNNGEERRSRVSLSFRDYDAFLSRGVPTGRHSISFSPMSTPSHSTFSLPLSQPSSPDRSPRRHFRRIRGLSMLRLHRSDSLASLNDGCPHCPQDLQSQRRAIHKLPCGHRLCTQALRNTIKSATESKKGAVPSCCGRPIPGTLVEQVMTQEEQNALLDRLEQWDEAISIAPSINSSRRDSIPQRRPGQLTARSRTVSEESRLDKLPLKARQELEGVMNREDYKLLRTGQAEQRDRFLAWADKQRIALQIKHDKLRDDMKARQEVAVEDMQEHHAHAMAEAEDKQVKAEADVRTTHATERFATATALKHMESFCAGIYSTGEYHDRPVTEQDWRELDKTRRIWDQMDVRHESAINVLRAEQSRRLRLRAQRQDRELQELKRQQRREELELERFCTSEMLTLDENVAEKRKRIRWRWDLQVAIFTKKVEAETGVHLDVRLPPADWHSHGSTLRQDSSATTKGAGVLAEEAKSQHGLSTGIAVHGNGTLTTTAEFKIGG